MAPQAVQPIEDSQSKDELREPPRLERARGLASLRQHASSRRFEGSVRHMYRPAARRTTSAAAAASENRFCVASE